MFVSHCRFRFIVTHQKHNQSTRWDTTSQETWKTYRQGKIKHQKIFKETFLLNWFHLDFCFLGALYDSSWCPHRMLFLRIWISPQVGVLSQLFWLWFKIHSLLVLRNSYPYFYGTGCWYNLIHLDSWKQNLEIVEKNGNLLDFTQRYAHAIFITLWKSLQRQLLKFQYIFKVMAIRQFQQRAQWRRTITGQPNPRKA